MFNKHKEKQNIKKIMDAHTPEISEYENIPTSQKHNEKKTRGYIALGSIGTALVTGAIITVVALNNTKPVVFEPSYQIVAPSKREKAAFNSYNSATHQYEADPNNTISSTTITLYKNYIKKIVPQVFSHDNLQSKSFSVVDAFINTCLTGYTSGVEIQNIVLTALGASNTTELKEAAKEIIFALGTPVYTSDGLTGGFTLQSLWFNEELPIKSDLSAIKDDLENYFYCSIFHHAPDEDEINKYYAANTPEEFSNSPQIKLAKDTKVDSAAISSFFVLDKYSPTKALTYLNQYQSGSHHISYTLLDSSKKDVDYVGSKTANSDLYVADGYVGADSVVDSLSFTYFYPEDATNVNLAVSKLATEDYTRKHPEQTDTSCTSCDYGYDITVMAPYFTINNDLDLKKDYKDAGIDIPSGNDLFGQIIDGNQFVVDMKQTSTITYDYNGIYAASKTIFTGAGATGPSPYKYELKLDHPYAFRINSQTIGIKGSSTSTTLPLIYGEIIDPSYGGR